MVCQPGLWWCKILMLVCCAIAVCIYYPSHIFNEIFFFLFWVNICCMLRNKKNCCYQDLIFPVQLERVQLRTWCQVRAGLHGNTVLQCDQDNTSTPVRSLSSSPVCNLVCGGSCTCREMVRKWQGLQSTVPVDYSQVCCTRTVHTQ